MIIRLMAAALLALSSCSAAFAANLGGNCCADLEERIAELEATSARKDNRKVSLTVYGQVNKAILWADGLGLDDKPNIIDNPNSTSRVGFKGEATITPEWSAGYVLEIGVSENWGTGSGLFDSGSFVIRHSAVYLRHGSTGKLTLGHTSQATDGIAEITLANIDVASTMLSLEPLSGVVVGGLISPNNLPFDGGRAQLVRFDTASIGGFTASASWADDETWDAALRFAGDLGGFKLAAGVGYRNSDANRVISGSASLMHTASGLFVNAAAGHFDGELAFTVLGFPVFTPDVELFAWHAQGGIEQSFFGAGRTSLYGEYAHFDVRGTDLEAEMWGFGAVQAIDAAAMDLYVGARFYDAEGEDLRTVVGGARIKF